MYYVYILHSQKDDKLYVGCTNDLERRFREHNSRKVSSTKNRAPLELVFYESFINKKDAFAREQWFKSGYGRNHMRKMLSETLKSLGG
jgi:putative endonuclease